MCVPPPPSLHKQQTGAHRGHEHRPRSMTRPKHITEGHIMRRYRCGLTEARAILARMVARGEVKTVHNHLGYLLHWKNTSETKK